jgi:hypothetical protein
MRIFGRANFNDTLALVLIAGLPALWLSSKWLPVPGEVLGATIAGWMLVVQFYFRKAQNGG